MGWEGLKEFYNSKLNNYSKFIKGRDQPLPPWSDSDVNEFIASDPLHGPALKTARETAKIAAVGSIIGAISIAGTSWKYSRSPHGAVLSLGFGAVVGWTFGKEIANHYLQTYRVDTMGAQVKFLEWWEKKSGGRSSESSLL